MSKHTPGPWTTRGLSDHVRVERVSPVGRINVARCGSSKPGPREPEIKEIWANASLIAAAPELLEEGKKLVTWLERLAENAEQQSKDTRFITLSEAQIADAKNFLIDRALGRYLREQTEKSK